MNRFRSTAPSHLVVLLFAGFLACNGEDLLLPEEAQPSALTVLQGNDQVGRVGEPLAEPVVALVTDSRGRPVADVPVALALPDGSDAQVVPESTRSDADGTASFQVVLGSGIGEGQASIVASFGQEELSAAVRFTAVSADAAGMTLAGGDGQAAPAGAALPDPLVVQVSDVFGNPIAGVPITWQAEGGGSVSAEVVATDADGRSAVERTLGPSAGLQRTRAGAPGLAGSPVTFVHTATAGDAARLESVSGDGQSAIVGTAVADPLVVRLLDAAGNPVVGTPVAWVVGQGAGSVAPETVTTDGNGLASTLWTLGTQPGPQTVTAVVSGIGVVRFNASAQPGTPPGIRLVAQPPDGARRGVPFSRSPVVQLVDPSGTDLARSGVRVTVGVAAGPGIVRGTLTRTTGADGRAGFDGLSLEGPAGTYTLAFSASGFAGVTSGPIQLARAATTTSIQADTPDPSAPGAAVRVVFTVSSEGGRPPGTVTVSADDGGSCAASVSAGACSLALSQTGSRTLTAAYPGTEEFEPSSDTESHTVEAPADPSLDLETEPPASAALGIPFDPAPVVQLRDGEGRVLRNGGVQVTAGIASGPGALIGETVRATDDQGRARFEGLGIGGSAGAHVIRFTAPGYTPVASRAVSVGAAGTTIRITSDEPDPSDPGEPVEVRYTVTSSAGAPSGSVTVSADGVSCTASVADGGCTIALSQPGNRTITASYAGGGPFAPSSATEGHTVNQPPEPPPPSTPSASASSVTVSPATIRVESGEANIVVTVRDEQGRAMGGVPVTVTASGSGNSITPGGETTRGNGEARFSLRSTVAETKTITAVADGVTLDDRPTLTVARAASATRIESDEPDPSEPGQPVTVRFTVQGEGGGTPGGVVTVTGVGDSCTAGAPQGSCDIVPAGSGTITARYEGDAEFEPSADDEPHEVRAAPPPAERVLRLETQPSSEARSGQEFERQPQVQLALETGEEVRESQVEVIASLASGGGTLTGPTSVQTDGNGRARFRDLVIQGSGTHILRFTATGYRPVTSEAIEVRGADDDDDGDDDIAAGPL